jgi:lysozyme family protein
MQDNFDEALERVLASEGGFVNHPRDPGGPTNRGITLATFSAFKRKPQTIDALKAITEDDVAAIYRAQYWNAVKGDDLPAGLDYALFDYAVNSGAGRAIRDLQAAIGVTVDGVMGAMTLAAIRSRDPAQIIASIQDRRLAFLKTLKTWRTFGRGWASRVEIVRTAALAMSAGIEGGVIEIVSASGKAREQDVSAIRTPQGKAKAAALVGAIGTGATQIATTIEPLSAQWQWIGAAAVALAIVGVIAGLVVQQMQTPPVPEAV